MPEQMAFSAPQRADLAVVFSTLAIVGSKREGARQTPANRRVFGKAQTNLTQTPPTHMPRLRLSRRGGIFRGVKKETWQKVRLGHLVELSRRRGILITPA